MTQKDLTTALLDWFNSTKNKRTRWRNDPIGILLREEMTKADHWKKARRGKPNKAFEKRAIIQWELGQ